MGDRGNNINEKIKLFGLEGLPVGGVLDTPEKAREFRDDVARDVEPELQRLHKAAGKSQVKASEYVIR